MRNFAYVMPETIEQAAAAAKQKDTVLKAGGIDLLDMMKGNLIRPERLVNLLSLGGRALREISAREDGVHVGALVTVAQLAAHPAVPPVLAHAASLAATPQIRNLATVAGNIAQRPRCWYFRSDTFNCARKGGDMCYAQKGDNRYHALFDNTDCAVVQASSTASPLVALGATVVTNKRSIPIEQFFVGTPTDITKEHVLGQGEIITEIVIPASAKGLKGAYREAAERESSDWALVSASVALDLDGNLVKSARVVLGAVAAIPHRAGAAEEALRGKPVTAANATKAAEAAFAGAKPFELNAYKVPLGKAILKRAILAAAGQPETSVGG